MLEITEPEISQNCTICIIAVNTMDPNAAQGAEIAPRKLVISLVALCLILLIREQRGSCIFDKHNECDKSHHVSTRGD